MPVPKQLKGTGFYTPMDIPPPDVKRKKLPKPDPNNPQIKEYVEAVEKGRHMLIKGSDIKPIEFVSSGISELDALTQLPKGRITEFYGMQGVGKTTLVTKTISEMSKTSKVLYIDAENALNPGRLTELGANNKNITIATTYVLEDVADLTIDSIGKYDIIVVDSVASLIPRAEDDGETGDMFMGLKARLMGQFMRKLVGRLGKSSTAVVFINQLRETMELYGPKKSTPGGHALPFAASLRIELSTTKADRIKDKDGGFKGHWVNLEITKSKVCRPYQKTRFRIDY
jgi:recombination protein RecA